MKPIIKIKTGTGKPPDYSITTINPTDGSPSYEIQNGLSAAEMGVNLTPNSYAFYIGNSLGKAITFGAEIDSNPALGTSDFKIPTQKAVKDYIVSFACPPVNLSSQILTRHRSTTDGNQTVPQLTTANPNNSIVNILFPTQDTSNTTTGGITDLTYAAATGIFTNSGSNILYLLVLYQVTWTGFGVSQTYVSNTIIRSSWIQKNPTDTANLSTNVYGFTTILLPPLGSGLQGSVTGTQTGTALITLNPNESFSIRAKNHNTAAASGIASSASSNITGANTSIFSNATRVQIIRI